MMDRDTKIVTFWALFVLGGIVAFSQVFAPVHELGHLLRSFIDTGEFGKMIDWTHAQVPPNINQALAGYGFEVFVFCILGLCIGGVSQYNSGNYWTGSFFIGHAAVSAGRAFNGYDMNGYIRDLILYEGIDPSVTQNMIIAVHRRWYLICAVFAFVTLVSIVYWQRKSPSR